MLFSFYKTELFVCEWNL